MNRYILADIIQVLIARYYERELGSSEVSVGNRPNWDIKFQDGTTMEVKLDTAAKTSGNAAIEYWDLRRNKATGILGTAAKIWLHLIPEGEGLRIYEFEVDRLRRAVIEGGKVITGGDENASVMKLLQVEILKKVSSASYRIDDDLLRHLKYW
jgi:hypothetical protein